MKPILKKTSGGSAFRKVAVGSWDSGGDPSVYGLIEIDMTNSLAHLERINEGAKTKVSISHLVGKAIAIVMSQRPEINGMILLSRIHLRKHVDLFYQLNLPGSKRGEDSVSTATLAGAIVRKAEELSVFSIAEQLDKIASESRENNLSNELVKTANRMKYMPWWAMKSILNISSFLNFDLGLNLKWAGLPRDPFGSVMITNIGSLGLEQAWAPLVRYTKVPLLLTVGKISMKPWVVGTTVVPRPIMKIGVTFDHRFMDGVHAAEMHKIFQQCFAHPEQYFI